MKYRKTNFLSSIFSLFPPHLVTQKVSIQIIPITIGLIVLATVNFGALLICVNNQLKFCRRVCSAVLTSDFGVERILALGSFLEHDTLNKVGGRENYERWEI